MVETSSALVQVLREEPQLQVKDSMVEMASARPRELQLQAEVVVVLLPQVKTHYLQAVTVEQEQPIIQTGQLPLGQDHLMLTPLEVVDNHTKHHRLVVTEALAEEEMPTVGVQT